MKLLVFASDEFAIEPIRSLYQSKHEVIALAGSPDRPAGRGLNLARTPALEEAERLGIKIIQLESLSPDELEKHAINLTWDVGLVVAFGRIIPPWLLAIPPKGFINLHPSLLPRYRGAAPIERAIMSGASITGVTTIMMNEKLDAGDIIAHIEVPILEDDTAKTLCERLSRAGARLLVETLDALEEGSLKLIPQEEEKATYAPPIRPEDCLIDWGEPAEKLERKIRALNPKPGAYTYFRGKRLKIWSARVTDVPQEGEPGTIQEIRGEGFIVNTGSFGLQPLIVQLEGRKSLNSAEFLRGQRIRSGERFNLRP